MTCLFGHDWQPYGAPVNLTQDGGTVLGRMVLGTIRVCKKCNKAEPNTAGALHLVYTKEYTKLAKKHLLQSSTPTTNAEVSV